MQMCLLDADEVEVAPWSLPSWYIDVTDNILKFCARLDADDGTNPKHDHLESAYFETPLWTSSFPFDHHHVGASSLLSRSPT